jgi:hypothetical protein
MKRRTEIRARRKNMTVTQQKLNGTTAPYFGVPNSSSSEVIIEDKYLRKVLIEAAMKAEELLRTGAIDVSRSIVSKPNQWGLLVETTMEQPKPNKPVIYKFRYKLDVVVYNQWLEEHEYMLGEEGALVFTSRRGLKIMIMPNMKKHPVAQIITHYGDRLDDKEYHVDMAMKSVDFIIHREIINLHDWIVKCVVDE